MTRLTSIEAAALFGVDRTTTRKAAAFGHVAGAAQEPRPGSINPPWVADQSAWEQWYATRRQAGRPKREEGPEMRDLGNGFAALIHPYRARRVGGHMGTEIWDPCNLVEVVRDAGTDRQFVWAQDFVVAGTQWDAAARNKIGGTGAFHYVRPTEEEINAAVDKLLGQASAAWERAQDNIYVIVANHRPIGMVRTPLARHAAAAAAQYGGLARSIPAEDDWIETASLRDAWQQYGLPDWEEYQNSLQPLLIDLVRTRAIDIERQTGEQMSCIRFGDSVRRAQTYEQFLPLARTVLAWLQGETTEYPAGVETGKAFRRAYWGPNSPYAQE